MTPRLLLSAAAVVTFTGSFAGSAAAQPLASASPPVVYHHKDTGRTVSVERGTTFKVSLKACGDCGQWWSFAHRPAASTVKVTHRRIKPEAKPPAVGGDNHTIWTFKAIHKGKTTMRIVEHSAEDGNKVIKHFTLTVKVR